MTAPALPFVCHGGAMHPLGRVRNVFGSHYGEGEIVMLAPVEERSEATHKHQFAWLKDAWMSLPPHLAEQYPSVEMLRKRGLIATSHCTVQDYVCTSQAEAARWAANLRREVDEFALVIVKASVVRIFRAKSQAKGAMDKAEFQAAKTDLLDWVSNLLGVDADALAGARAA